MKQVKLVAMIFSMLAVGVSTARAQVAAGPTPAQTQKMEEALERLKGSMSNGGSESVSGAADGVFMNLAGFGGEEAPAVRSEPQQRSKAKARLANYKPGDCWEVCVSWGPLHVCYTWETRCR